MFEHGATDDLPGVLPVGQHDALVHDDTWDKDQLVNLHKIAGLWNNYKTTKDSRDDSVHMKLVNIVAKKNYLKIGQILRPTEVRSILIENCPFFLIVILPTF